MSGKNRGDVERALRAVNRDFYRDHADTFDATRGKPWRGWSRILTALGSGRAQSILDIGCGNARLVEVLGPHLAGTSYAGLDSSPALLLHARRRLDGMAGLSWRLLAWDALSGVLPARRGDGYSLVVIFGFLHHVPGREALTRLLDLAFDRVAHGGHLAVSFWQFGDLPRFRGKSLPAASVGLDADDLGDGDYLLPWQRVPGAVRFCHHTPPVEADRLMDGLPGRIVDRFRTDGATDDLNLYYLLHKERGWEYGDEGRC